MYCRSVRTHNRGASDGPNERKAESMKNELVLKGKLVTAMQLLEQLFDPDARPSVRWLRAQTKAKAIPYVRIGPLVFFDVDMVRTALAVKNLVRHRMFATSSPTQG